MIIPENDENRESSIEELRQLVLDDANLKCRITDDFLIKFLRARKFHIPRAFGLLKKHMGFKEKNQNIFTGMDYEVFSNLIADKVFGFIPYRCPDGCVILVVSLNNWNTRKYDIQDISRAVILFFYHSICDPLTQINGYKVIFDVNSSGLAHIRFASPKNLCLLYNGTQECFPGRFKEIHIMNMSMTFQIGWAIVKPFLSQKLRKRIIFHDNYESLGNYFPKNLIPVEFDGELKEYDTTPWLKLAIQEENLKKLAH
ncbi:clavesin-2 [Caerostris extrusa]|uniref:Clavesin-2 n=1 Tax=Caerostris extrusa TaxID=172846 RepID=A0AAV4QLK7_CAEEX|nr:clavesin-2 [Caerostris extrusa]